MPDRFDIEWVTDTDGLAALRAEWDALLSDSAADSVFLTWDWVSAWWTHFGTGRDLKILVLRDREDGRLAALAPLVAEQATWLGLVPMRRLALIGAGIAAADHLDVILRSGLEAEAGKASWDALAAASADWDALVLEGLSQTSPMPAVWKADPRTASALFSTNTCRYLPLPATWEAYLQTMPSKRRRRIGWRRRRLEKEFPDRIRFRTITEADDLAPAMESLFRLHQTVQTDRGNPGSFATEAMRAFHLDVARRFLDQGRLRLHLITVGDEDIAAIYCYRHGPVLSFYSTGFAPDWDRHNPGRQVMAFSIENAIGDGAAEYDFLRGDESYKEAFSGDLREDLNLRIAIKPGARVLLRLEAAYKALRRTLRPLKAKLRGR